MRPLWVLSVWVKESQHADSSVYLLKGVKEHGMWMLWLFPLRTFMFVEQYHKTCCQLLLWQRIFKLPLIWLRVQFCHNYSVVRRNKVISAQTLTAIHLLVNSTSEEITGWIIWVRIPCCLMCAFRQAALTLFEAPQGWGIGSCPHPYISWNLVKWTTSDCIGMHYGINIYFPAVPWQRDISSQTLPINWPQWSL